MSEFIFVIPFLLIPTAGETPARSLSSYNPQFHICNMDGVWIGAPDPCSVDGTYVGVYQCLW